MGIFSININESHGEQALMSIKQKIFGLSELKQFSLMWKSLEVPGLSANYIGRITEPSLNGFILLTFAIDGWLARDLIHALYGKGPDGFTDRIRSDDTSSGLTVQIIKMGSTWKEFYLVNLSIIHEQQQKYIGSVCEKTAEDLILSIQSIFNMKKKAFGSTLDAQEYFLRGR
jgi:hypothetical protein